MSSNVTSTAGEDLGYAKDNNVSSDGHDNLRDDDELYGGISSDVGNPAKGNNSPANYTHTNIHINTTKDVVGLNGAVLTEGQLNNNDLSNIDYDPDGDPDGHFIEYISDEKAEEHIFGPRRHFYFKLLQFLWKENVHAALPDIVYAARHGVLPGESEDSQMESVMAWLFYREQTLPIDTASHYLRAHVAHYFNSIVSHDTARDYFNKSKPSLEFLITVSEILLNEDGAFASCSDLYFAISYGVKYMAVEDITSVNNAMTCICPDEVVTWLREHNRVSLSNKERPAQMFIQKLKEKLHTFEGGVASSMSKDISHTSHILSSYLEKMGDKIKVAGEDGPNDVEMGDVYEKRGDDDTTMVVGQDDDESERRRLIDTQERVSSNSEAMLGKRKSVDFDQDEMLPVTKKPASATPSVPKIKLQQGSTSPLSHAAVTKLMPPSSSRPLSPTERSPLKPLMMDKQLNSQPPSKTKPVVLEFSSLIAAFLDIESLCQFSKVNQEFHHVSKAEDLWKRLCISDTMFGVVHLENFIRMFNMTWRTAYPIVRGLDERSQVAKVKLVADSAWNITPRQKLFLQSELPSTLVSRKIVEDVTSVFCELCEDCTFPLQSLHRCPNCNRSVCSGRCHDEYWGCCKDCSGNPIFKKEEVKVLPSHQFTPELDQEIVRLRRLGHSHSNVAKFLLPLRLVDGNRRVPWTQSDVSHRWNKNLRHRIDDDGNLLPEGHDEGIDEEPDFTLPLAPQTKHSTDVRSLAPYGTVFTKRGINGNFGLDSTFEYDAKTSPSRILRKTIKLRNWIVHSIFYFLWTCFWCLLSQFIENESLGRQRSNFSIREKQQILTNFVHGMNICMSFHTPTFLDPSDTPRKRATDGAIETTLLISSTLIMNDSERIERDVQQQVDLPQVVEEKLDKYHTDLSKDSVTETLQFLTPYVKSFGSLSKKEKTFVYFKENLMPHIHKLAKDFPQFKCFETFDDISDMTEEAFLTTVPRVDKVGELSNYIQKLVHAECMKCGASMLALTIEGARSFDLNHNDRSQKNGKNPSKIRNPMELRKAIIQQKMGPEGFCCHLRNEDKHEDQRPEAGVCFLPRPKPNRDEGLTPKQIIMGEGELEDLGMWNRISQQARTKFLHPITWMFMFFEFVYIGAFSGTQFVSFTFNTIRVLFLAYWGRLADDFCRFSPYWFNCCRGEHFKNDAGTRVSRSHLSSTMLQNLLVSLCLWDPDTTLHDDYAGFWNLSPNNYFSVSPDHFGGKNKNPTKLQNSSMIFCLNEYVSYLLPMFSYTHKIRTSNQKREKRPNQKEHNVPRNFESQSLKKFSKARMSAITAYKED